jgi:hypothetical protein
VRWYVPRRCSICSHESRDEIDRALVRGVSTYALETSYSGLSRSALERHGRNGHISTRVLEAAGAEEVRGAFDVVAQLKSINLVCASILQEARDNQQDNPDLALRAVDRLHRQVELQSRLLGDLDDRPVVNIMASPEWIEVKHVIFGALEQDDAAYDAVVRALEEGLNGNGS